MGRWNLASVLLTRFLHHKVLHESRPEHNSLLDDTPWGRGLILFDNRFVLVTEDARTATSFRKYGMAS
jgi:hypothetical protein